MASAEEISTRRVAPAISDIAPTTNDVREAASTTPFRQPFAVHLGPLGYRLAWIGIYLFHAACALYCFAAAVLFHETQTTFMILNFSTFNKILAPRFFPAVAIAHCIVGVVHTCFAVEPIARIAYRCVASRYLNQGPSRTGSAIAKRLATIPLMVEQRAPALHRVMTFTYISVFSPQGLFGIDSRHFDSLLLIREIVECGLQTHQAFQMCQHLSREWLNRLFVATLILNCWITPVLHHVIANRPLQRLLDRLLDVVLDFLASVGVPLALVWSYWWQYDPEMQDFPNQYWFDDLWAIRIRNESPLVFFGSWMDAFSRLVFSLGLLLSLDDIKIILRNRRANRVTIKPSQPPIHGKPRPCAVQQTTRPLRLGHRVLFAFGVVVLAVHLHSELRPLPRACLLVLRPWLVTKPTCVIIEFNCYTDRTSTGTAHEFDLVFDNLNPAPLSRISFRHCRTLEIQKSIQQFTHLDYLKVYNSTVAAWSDQAELTNASHPILSSVNFARTNFRNGALPDGLLSHDFPRSMLELIVSVTNLQRIPDDLDKRWPPGMVLAIEWSQLSEYPSAFTRIRAIAVLFRTNAISEISPAAFEAHGLIVLQLMGNPITKLPDNVVLSSTLGMIHLDSTNISTMPMWLLDAAAAGDVFVTAGRTPYCGNLMNGASGDSSHSSSDADRREGLVRCVDKGPVTTAYRFEDEERESEVW